MPFLDKGVGCGAVVWPGIWIVVGVASHVLALPIYEELIHLETLGR